MSDALKIKGPALMTMVLGVATLTDSCLSTLSGFKYQLGHVRKLPVTCGKEMVFTGYSGFLPHSQMDIHDLAAIWQRK